MLFFAGYTGVAAQTVRIPIAIGISWLAFMVGLISFGISIYLDKKAIDRRESWWAAKRETEHQRIVDEHATNGSER